MVFPSMNIQIFVFSFYCWWTFGFFPLFAIINSAFITVFYVSPNLQVEEFFQIMYMALESMKVRVCAGNTKSFPKELCQFTLALAVDESSHCSASHSNT